MKKEGISLGWNCSAAQDGLLMGLRSDKKNGYKTGPFDMMISNYIGVCKCIEDDFKYFCDPNYLVLKDAPNMTSHIPNQKTDELWIYNTYYNFAFNHESPYHGNLYLNEMWSSPNHFVENNFERFIERYERRINNFRDYLMSDYFINFIVVRYNSAPIELRDIIRQKYPNLNFNISWISSLNNNNIGHLYDTTLNGGINYEIDYLNYMGINNETFGDELKRYRDSFKDNNDYDNITKL
jgi:hypothetical protein